MNQKAEKSRRSAETRQDLRPQQPWHQKELRILSIDGGGIRGILPAAVLAICEERFTDGRPAGEFFDYIGGTSTGGIIALGLSIGLRASQILTVYMDHGAEIFPPAPEYESWIAKNLQATWQHLRSLRRYKYDRAALEKHLKNTLGENLLGEAQQRLVIPSFDDYNEVNLFKTPHHPDYKRDWQERMIDIALATSAAPTFFATYKNGDRHFADGGVWANNPIMTVLVDALICYQVDRRDIQILSLGCVESDFGFTQGQISKGGIWHWREIISAAMRLQSQNALGQAGLLIGRDHLLRIDGVPMKNDPIALDDYVRAAKELPKIAQDLVDQNADRLKEFFSELRPTYPAAYGPRVRSSH